MPKNETLQVPCSPFFRFVPYRVARFLARFFAAERAAPGPPAPSLLERSPCIVRTSFTLGRCVTNASGMNCYPSPMKGTGYCHRGFKTEVRYIALPTTDEATFCYWRHAG